MQTLRALRGVHLADARGQREVVAVLRFSGLLVVDGEWVLWMGGISDLEVFRI